MRGRLLTAGVALVVGGAVVTTGLALWARGQRGFSARDEPSAVERVVATALRRGSVSAAARAARNPFPASPEILAEARAHFADHCASCHANNGSGDTPIGRNLYPRAPDMRQADTQSLSDGELYWVIHHGIRLSGMPAWGAADRDDDSWKLVAFIRHLPALSREEERLMERFNPRSQAEAEEEEQDRRFLAGDDARPTQPPSTQRTRP